MRAEAGGSVVGRREECSMRRRAIELGDEEISRKG